MSNISLNQSKRIFDEIQLNKNEDCKGCIFLKETNQKPNFTSEVLHLSIEHHSVCNLRCDYCSEVYWGGKRSKYKVADFVKNLSENKNLSNCRQVVWGGGEPTLDKSFEEIFEKIHLEANPKMYHRVFTNSVRFSEPLNKFLKKGVVKITTSIDAGTEETFKKVRGRQKLYEVFKNLSIYSKNDPSKITIKYIFTKDNYSEKELDAFVEKCINFNLNECNYQISTNYKNKNLEFELFKGITYLFHKLLKNKINRVFLDDHIVIKFGNINKSKFNELKKYLLSNKADEIILSPYNLDDLIVYGSGTIAKQLIQKTNFFKNIKNFNIVDSDLLRQGKSFCSKKIQSPEIIKDKNCKILIASAQHYDEIHKNIINYKFC